MTLRQQIRIRLLLSKRTFQLGRQLTEREMHEVLAVALDETKILFQSIGGLSVAWAQVETVLDYFNGVLIMHRNHPELELPRSSLKSKIGFFKRSFDLIPELVPFRERAAKIVSELNRLKTIRHDAVHGVALKRIPVGTHKAIRLNVKGKDITQQQTTYKLPDIAFAANDVLALLRELDRLFRDVFSGLYPDLGTQVFGDTMPAAPPATTLLSRTTENNRATHQRPPKRLVVSFLIIGIVGLLIGGVGASWFEVLVVCMGWGVVTWLLRVLIALKASQGSHKSGPSLFSGSTGLTRFIVW